MQTQGGTLERCLRVEEGFPPLKSVQSNFSRNDKISEVLIEKRPTRPFHISVHTKGVINVIRGFRLEKSTAGKYGLSEQMRRLWAGSILVEKPKILGKTDSGVKRTIYLHLTSKV